MHISAVEEYGLRCALQLASLEDGEVLAASQIAEKEGISVQYASKIMHLFRKAGLVQAVRGMQGGFSLVDKRVPIRNIFVALKEDKEDKEFCSQYKGQLLSCVHLQDCSVRPVWNVLSQYFDSVLEQITLADLARGEEESRKRIEIFAKSQADKIRFRFGANTELGSEAVGSRE